MRTASAGLIRRLAVVCLAAAAAVVPTPQRAIERWYSNGVYPPLQRTITSFSNLVPFAWFDLLWVSAAAGVAVWIYRRLHRRPRSRAIRTVVLEAATAASLVYLAFLALWGLNYRRVPISARVDFDRARITRPAAGALGIRTAAELNELYAEAHRQQTSNEALAAVFAGAQRSLGARWIIVPGRPKQTLLGQFFHQTATTGMTDPFFLETLIAPDLLDAEKPFVIAHEWAHLAGYADESEANFVAWLACQHGDAAARYSAALVMIEFVQPPNQTLQQALTIGPRIDLYAIRERYRRTNRVLQAAARESYDAYLKANRVKAGIVSYDLVVQLVLGTAFDQQGNPVLR